MNHPIPKEDQFQDMREALRDLCNRTGDAIFLTIRTGFDAICVARKIGSHPIQVFSLEVGARHPLGVGVGGLVILAKLGEDVARTIINANEARLVRYKLSKHELMNRLCAARDKDYAFAEIGVIPGTRAVAVPILSPCGKPLAAISIATMINRMPQTRLSSLVAQMHEQARLITHRLRD